MGSNPLVNTGEDTLNLLHSIFKLPRLNLFGQEKEYPDTNPLYPFRGAEQPGTGKEDKAPTDPDMERQRQQREAESTPPLPEPNPNRLGDALLGAPSGAQGMSVPAGTVGDNPAIKAALLQMGLNFLTPTWGGSLANIGVALGNAAEAYTRVKQSGQKDTARALATSKAEADIDATKALAEARRSAAQTSKEKRLNQKTKRSTEFERLSDALDIGPKGKLYLKEALKTLDDENLLAEDDGKTLEQKYNEIIANARSLDGQVLPNETVAPKGGTPTAGYPKGYVYTREDGAQLRLDGDDWQNPDDWTIVKQPPKEKKAK